jgi:hypothetical protein
MREECPELVKLANEMPKPTLGRRPDTGAYPFAQPRTIPDKFVSSYDMNAGGRTAAKLNQIDSVADEDNYQGEF